MKTPLIIEQHFHGAYGTDFNKADADEIIVLAEKLKSLGIGGFFPTLVTDSCENIKRQIGEIKKAASLCKGILGIHLEGIFINPAKKGIHNTEHFLELTVDNYKKIEDDFIKIVTLAPELDKGLISYLKEKNVKVQAGHCMGWGDVDGVTHTFNAIICDGLHVSDDALKLFFKAKKSDKVILISDSLPITYSNIKETTFADSKIYYDGNSAVSADGTIAGSTKLLPEIIKILGRKGLFSPEFIENIYNYHGMKLNGCIEWDDDFNITKILF